MGKMTVLIWQMGRVGSVALRKSLEASQIDARHAHYLFHDGEYYRTKKITVEEVFNPSNPWKVVSIARDPIARNLSAFMVDLQSKINRKEHALEPLRKRFINYYNHDWCLNWFQNELCQIVDVFNQPFRNSQVLSNGTTDVLLLRTENLNNCAAAMNGFLNVTNFSMLYSNSAEALFKYYKQFKQYMRGRIPVPLMDKYYYSAYAQHFYTPKELIRLREFWTNPYAPEAFVSAS